MGVAGAKGEQCRRGRRQPHRALLASGSWGFLLRAFVGPGVGLNDGRDAAAAACFRKSRSQCSQALWAPFHSRPEEGLMHTRTYVGEFTVGETEAREDPVTRQGRGWSRNSALLLPLPPGRGCGVTQWGAVTGCVQQGAARLLCRATCSTSTQTGPKE